MLASGAGASGLAMARAGTWVRKQAGRARFCVLMFQEQAVEPRLLRRVRNHGSLRRCSAGPEAQRAVHLTRSRYVSQASSWISSHAPQSRVCDAIQNSDSHAKMG